MIFMISVCLFKCNKLNEVLVVMGLLDKFIEGSIRLLFGVIIIKEDIVRFKEIFIIIYEEIKELLK